MKLAMRWVLALTLAGVAVALLHEPQRPPDAAAAVASPARAPASAPPAAPAPSAASAASAAGAPPAAPPAAPAPAPRIGSEGYGPHIERAWSNTDASAAWEAVRWLRLCATNEARRSALEQGRHQGVVPELLTQWMVEADAEARRCQTVTAQHQAWLPELAGRAMRAGVPEAASAYAEMLFPRELTAQQRQEVADALRRDALAGHPQSLLNASLSNPEWGLSDAEKLAFLHAYGAVSGAHEVVARLLQPGRLGLSARPTPAQLDAAREAGQRIAAGKP